MQKITPCLWFNDGEAEEAAKFYTDKFDDSRIGEVLCYDKASAVASGQPEGSVLTVEFEIEGVQFLGLNGGGMRHERNPSISFFVRCASASEVESFWEQLSTGGMALMPLGEYPFSSKYGWCADKYGVSWQIMLVEGGIPSRIVPSLMFVGDVCGHAEAAVNLYTSLFVDSGAGELSRYGEGHEPDKPGTIMYGEFKLSGQQFAVMDSGHAHQFKFNEAVSLIVNCADQAEVDHFWEALTVDDGAPGRCGWLTDRFGVSWQIIPTELPTLIRNPAAMQAMMQMSKIDLDTLRAAAA